jgi:protease-4
MDEGIRGRATSAHLRKLAKRRDLAAVVFRADSPGGEALPSELVADGIRQVKKNGRPVVVTQGFVAGSGGYWISMDGSRILTTPLTITGSVGVTGGWAWDAGVGEKTGIAADGVMRGSHADLFTGIRFPFIGSVLPVRNLTERERDGVKDRFLELYGDFVRRVAEARGLPEARVRELGEGRIWIGADAIGNGLCDTLGTLDGAVATAKAMAGLDPDDEVILTEFPPRRLFSLPKLAGGLPGIGWLASRLAASIGGSRADPPAPVETAPYDTRYVEAILANPGAPLLLVPPDLLPEDWRSE